MGPVHVVGAAVIDGSGRDPSNIDITVENGRITRLGASSAHGERLDAEGLTMTPGLIDAHVHLGLSSPIQPHFLFHVSAAEIAADIFATADATLDAGFTTVRDTGGIDGGVVTAIAKGKIRGPRVLSCGPVQCQIGGSGYYGAEWEPAELWNSHHIPGLCALSMMAGNADELRRNVREAFRRGASFLKLCVTGGVVGAHARLTDTQFHRRRDRRCSSRSCGTKHLCDRSRPTTMRAYAMRSRPGCAESSTAPASTNSQRP
ncbi:amidohydrolase family protein [Streptomyces microflavus]|uniref:amidohydrolase family protein n=1 Tax=Streptomyces microflavus TaxID=1919 RepID=UPI003B224608